MTSLQAASKDENHHPIDIVEQLAEFNEWNFDRRSDDRPFFWSVTGVGYFRGLDRHR